MEQVPKADRSGCVQCDWLDGTPLNGGDNKRIVVTGKQGSQYCARPADVCTGVKAAQWGQCFDCDYPSVRNNEGKQ